ncbi:dTDP-4-dehydrorhamnose 3,5-epimerase [Candidatus Omnitrophota bacterium]
MPFHFKKLEIPDVLLIGPKVFEDERGFFVETYKYTDFAESGLNERFVQDNHSRSIQGGTLRGLHYQGDPKAQAKLIRVVKGSIFDVAVDIRPGSDTYGKWVSATLSADSKEMMYIPKGFAHGFCTLEDDTEIIYKCSEAYSPEHDRGIIWNDPTIGINWPTSDPVLSERDKNWPSIEKVVK